MSTQANDFQEGNARNSAQMGDGDLDGVILVVQNSNILMFSFKLE